MNLFVTFFFFLSVQVQKGLEKAKKEEARLRQDLNKAKEKEKEEKKRVREDLLFSHFNFYTLVVKEKVIFSVIFILI